MKFVSPIQFFFHCILNDDSMQDRVVYSLVFECILSYLPTIHTFQHCVCVFSLTPMLLLNSNAQHVCSWLLNSVVVLLCQHFMHCFTFSKWILANSWTSFISCIIEIHALNYLQLSCHRWREKNAFFFKCVSEHFFSPLLASEFSCSLLYVGLKTELCKFNIREQNHHPFIVVVIVNRIYQRCGKSMYERDRERVRKKNETGTNWLEVDDCVASELMCIFCLCTCKAQFMIKWPQKRSTTSNKKKRIRNTRIWNRIKFHIAWTLMEIFTHRFIQNITTLYLFSCLSIIVQTMCNSWTMSMSKIGIVLHPTTNYKIKSQYHNRSEHFEEYKRYDVAPRVMGSHVTTDIFTSK